MSGCHEAQEDTVCIVENVGLGVQDLQLSANVADSDLTIVDDDTLARTKNDLLLTCSDALDESEVDGVDFVDVGLLNEDGTVVVPGKTNLSIVDNEPLSGSQLDELLSCDDALLELEVRIVDFVDVGLLDEDRLVAVPRESNLTIIDNESLSRSEFDDLHGGLELVQTQ